MSTKRAGAVSLIALIASCGARPSTSDIARQYSYEQNIYEGFSTPEWGPAAVEVLSTFKEGPCTVVQVIEPDHEGWSGKMSVVMRDSKPIDYITGHLTRPDSGSSECRD